MNNTKENNSIEKLDILYNIEGLSPDKKLILIALGKIAIEKKIITFDDLIRMCNISKETVLKHLNFFRWLGWFKKRVAVKDGMDVEVNSLNIEFIKECVETFKHDGIEFANVEFLFDYLYKYDKAKVTERCPYSPSSNTEESNESVGEK